jgi:hypothetical protein
VREPSAPRWWLYAVVWLALIVAITVLTDWRELDWRLFVRLLQPGTPRWSQDLVVIDVPANPAIAVFRARLIGLMERIAEGQDAIPRAVVLDVQITPEPEKLEQLEAAIRRLQGKGVKVYAAIDPRHPSGLQLMPDYMTQHAARLYGGVLDGAGHTLFEMSAGVAKYDPYLDLGRGISIPALAVKLAEDLWNRPLNAPNRPIILVLGDARTVAAHSLRFEAGRLRPVADRAAAAPLHGKVAIVGSLHEDLPTGAAPSGPERLAWAVAARAATLDNRFEVEVLANIPLLIAATLLYAGATVAVAIFVYRVFPRTHTYHGVILAAAVVAPTAVLVAGILLLAKVRLVYPQVTLPFVGIVLAAALSWWFARRYLIARVADPASDPLDEEYDVFVSYTRTPPENEAWVREHVVQPLNAAAGPTGKALRVFFDQRTIRPGELWFKRLAHAIHASRFFLPVYSAEYFSRDFCQMEMERAAVRQVRDPSFIIALARGAVPIPVEYELINYIDVTKDDRFIERVLATMREVWTQDRATASVAREGLLARSRRRLAR